MKKFIIVFALILSIGISSNNAAAQQRISPTVLKSQINEAPKNKYGVQRIDYGIWDTTNVHNIWACRDPKRGYMLCEIKNGKLLCEEINPNNKKVETLLSKLDKSKWVPVEW